MGGDLAPARYYWFAKTTHSITAHRRAWRYNRPKVNFARPHRWDIDRQATMSSSGPVLLPRSPHHAPYHPPPSASLSPAALAYPPPLHLFLREKDRREGRRTTESRCGPFIVLRLSFVRQRNPMKLTFIYVSLRIVRSRHSVKFPMFVANMR